MNILPIFPLSLQLFPYNTWHAYGWHENITCTDLFSLGWVWILPQNNEAQKVEKGGKMKYRWKIKLFIQLRKSLSLKIAA